MSRIGRMPIRLPTGVSVVAQETAVVVSGQKGAVTVPIDTRFEVRVENNQVEVVIRRSGSVLSNLHGLTRALINNAVIGVSQGWKKTVELIGVGYRAQGGGSDVTLSVGFTHPVKVVAPPNVVFSVDDNTKITVSGIDKKVVGETAAKLRAIKPPEPYKGKGIRFLGEMVRKKAGKAVKAAGVSA